MAIQDDYPTGAGYYEFRIKGLLRSDWSDWLEGLIVTQLENGDTLLTGLITDQVALHGVLAKIRDLSLVLVSVRQAGKV